MSDLNIYGTIDAWCNRSIEGEHPYVFYDGILLLRETEGEVMIRRQLKCRVLLTPDLGAISFTLRVRRVSL